MTRKVVLEDQMTSMQLALEEKIDNLSIIAQGENNCSRKGNSKDGRNNSGNNNAHRDKNNLNLGRHNSTLF